MDLKKYFRVIVKPIALTALFLILVIWLYFAFAPIVRERLPAHMRSEAAVEEELARLSTLGTFLAGVFRGDLGFSEYTGDYVSKQLGPRLQVTLLFIGISIVLSLITGIIAVLIALLWKPAARKPQTFAHSLRSYLFALTPFLGFILLVVFSFNLNWLPSGRLYPVEWILYPPRSLLEEIIGRLRHLVLPSLTLALILLARAVMVVWSGGSPILSERWSKRFLFTCATIDFAFIISAVLFVEWMFDIPGIGSFFFQSIPFWDFNDMIGAFITLLALAVLLGYASTIIDFLLRRSGLQEKLEGKIAEEPAHSEKQKESIEKKVKGTLWSLGRRKGFVTGFVIVAVFVLFAVFAPLITPYDPVRDIVGADLARPYWLPQLLNQNYSLNMNPINDPGFSRGPATLSNWNITADPQITYQYDASEGRLDGSGPGCLALVFSRTPQGKSYGQAIFKMEYTFEYDQSGPPRRFMGEIAWRVNTIAAGSSYRISVRIRNPISSYDLYVSQTSSEDTGGNWLTPWPPIDSYEGLITGRNPAREIFKVKGAYTYSVEIVFQNTYSSTDTPSIRIYLDDLDFKTLGDTFGLLGTDALGRDVWSQLLYGTRTILAFALPFAASATLIGFLFGFIGGYFQGWTDNILMTFVEAIFFIPVFPFLIVLMMWTIPMQGFPTLWASLVLFSAITASAFRNTFLMRPKNQKLKGNVPKDMFLYLARDLLVGFSLTMMSLILVLPSIELFIGLFDPNVASWGSTIREAWNISVGAEIWWWWLPPVIFTGLLAFGFFLLGSALDERFK